MSRARNGRSRRGADFDEFVLGYADRLLRSAVLLIADRQDAEDLVQDVLERLYVAWPRVEDPVAYAHRALTRAAINRWRRRSRRPQVPLAGHDVPAGDGTASVADRDAVLGALRSLPPGQRAVLVLRYFEDLSEAQIAAAMGCSPGTVKSQAARGLRRLRALLPDEARLPGGHHDR